MPLYIYGRAYAAPPGSTNAFDPSNSSTSLAFSGSNSIATQGGSGSYSLARAVDGATAGKYYWSITASTASGSMTPGCLVNNVFPKDFTFLGSENNGVGINVAGGTTIGFLLNNANVGNFAIGLTAALANGDVLTFAVDLANKLLWGKYNAGSWNNGGGDPVAGTGGYDFSTIVVSGNFYAAALTFQNTAVTANFAPAGLPAGFSYWA